MWTEQHFITEIRSKIGIKPIKSYMKKEKQKHFAQNGKILTDSQL